MKAKNIAVGVVVGLAALAIIWGFIAAIAISTSL
jgi:hypothetical protein